MQLLTRQQVIDHLRGAQQSAADARQLAGWAFDQFYAEEEGSIEYEPGFRRAIGAVLDDLMFADDPQFRLSAADLQRLIDQLTDAQPQLDDLDDDDL